MLLQQVNNYIANLLSFPYNYIVNIWKLPILCLSSWDPQNLCLVRMAKSFVLAISIYNLISKWV